MTPRGSIRRARGLPEVSTRGLQQDDKNNDKNNNKNNANDATSQPTAAPVAAPVFTPVFNPVAAPTFIPTMLPTMVNVAPIISTPVPTASASVTTTMPTIDDVFVGSFELQFSTYTGVTVEEQEPVLMNILNLAICSTGVELVTTAYEDVCPSIRMLQLSPMEDEPTILWNEPIVEAQWISKNVWRWNYTYRVLDAGNQSNTLLQSLLDESISEGRMDQALPWPASQAILIGNEVEFFHMVGIPSRSASAMRSIGSALLFFSITGVVCLTMLARRRRKVMEESTLEPTSPELGTQDENAFPDCYLEKQEGMYVEDKQNAFLEAMLLQSRQYAATNGPASLLNAGFPIPPADQSSDDDFGDDDDVMLGLADKIHQDFASLGGASVDGKSSVEGDTGSVPSFTAAKVNEVDFKAMEAQELEIKGALSSCSTYDSYLDVTPPLVNTSDDTQDATQEETYLEDVSIVGDLSFIGY